MHNMQPYTGDIMEYLVEGHYGSYYISDTDPNIIEQQCEQCEDSDTILTSWNPDEKNEKS